MITWFVRNPVAANLLMWAIIASGVFVATQALPIEIFPSVKSDTVTVQIAYPGATPEDVERGVVLRVEEALDGVTAIEELTATASEGVANISIKARDGYSGSELLEDVKTKVDAINTFPSDIERPVISQVEIFFEAITVIISGNISERALNDYSDQIYLGLKNIPGLSELKLSYVRDQEIAIEISQHKLAEYDLSLADVARAIEAASLDLSSGNVRTDTGDVLVRTRSQAYRRDEFERIVIRSFTDGSVLHLSDIARVHDDFVEDKLTARLNGQLASIISVNRAANADVIEVVKKVKRYLKLKQNELPDSVVLTTWDDNSKIVRDRLSTLINNALQGSFLIFLLLALFLKPRVAFWVFLGLPVSFTGALLVLWLLGGSINIISLFAFILVLGVVVDDAIITGENVYRHSDFQKTGEEAAIKGTQEIAVPVTFGVLTTVVAFIPIAFIEGDRSAVFAQIPLVVIPALLFSLVESKFILPAHMRDFKERNAAISFVWWDTFQAGFYSRFESFIKMIYKPSLSVCIRHRYLFLLFFITLLFLCIAMLSSGWLRFIFFPRVQSEEILVQFDMPTALSFEQSDREVRRIAGYAEVLQDKYINPDTNKSIIKHIFSATGRDSNGGFSGNGAASGTVVFELIPPEEQHLAVDSNALLAEWRSMIGDIQGAQSVSYRAELGGLGKPLHIQMYGDDINALRNYSSKLQNFLNSVEGISEVGDDLSDGKKELRINLLPAGQALGLRRVDIAQQVRQALYGYEVQRIQRGRHDVRVKVRYPLTERRSLSDLHRIKIHLPSGGTLPLQHVATLTYGQAPLNIVRIDGHRTVNISGDINKDVVNVPLLQTKLKEQFVIWGKQDPGVKYRFEGEIKEQNQSLSSVRNGLLFTLAAIYCLLAIPFRSYVQPLIVMLVLPFGLIGVVLGHLFIGIALSIMSVLGALALLGVMVNDALVMVDFTNKHKGNSRFGLMRGVKLAGLLRLRPIILTSLTTFIGLMPLLFDESTQAAFLKPMAISLGFGVLFASSITLFLVPVNYLILADIKELLNRYLYPLLQRNATIQNQSLSGGKIRGSRGKI